jgi:hypothetical protein
MAMKALAFALLLHGCARPEPAPAPLRTAASAALDSPASRASGSTPAAASDVPPAPAPPKAAPLAQAGELVALEVPGFLPAVVSVPLSARAAHPVAVAFHGNFDRPEWQCEIFRGVIGAHGFLLCPRGSARRDVPKQMDRWEYASGAKMAAELEAALTALNDRYGASVDPGPVVFIGFSLGAIYGAPIVQKAPARYPRAVFVEGGHGAWTVASAKKYAAGGGLRLFLACGQGPCLDKAKRTAPLLTRAGLPTQSGGSAKAGHTYDGAVSDSVRAAWPWLVEGDSRWSD